MSASLENFRRLSDGKDDNTWAQPPEPLTQAVGDSFSVVVTHLLSPSEIIVQKVENAGKRCLFFIMKTYSSGLQYVCFGIECILVYRSDSGIAAEAEGRVLSGSSSSELQTSPWHSLLCPVLRYKTSTY